MWVEAIQCSVWLRPNGLRGLLPWSKAVKNVNLTTLHLVRKFCVFTVWFSVKHRKDVTSRNICYFCNYWYCYTPNSGKSITKKLLCNVCLKFMNFPVTCFTFCFGICPGNVTAFIPMQAHIKAFVLCYLCRVHKINRFYRGPVCLTDRPSVSDRPRFFTEPARWISVKFYFGVCIKSCHINLIISYSWGVAENMAFF